MALPLLGAPRAVAADAPAIRPHVARACSVELARFCPELTPSRYENRNEAICLKPFRSDLSPGCRAAVKALFP